ncbi:hypothetical protein [Streptomyces sp. CBMA123]|uniref:hypothetical protein n=1 Tax=Streptomyces sp. CBMA123 TaxID=1896313 RepID=UPI001661FD00|nr:hypothetical protein [Streptomyces sp. CBMA123]
MLPLPEEGRHVFAFPAPPDSPTRRAFAAAAHTETRLRAGSDAPPGTPRGRTDGSPGYGPLPGGAAGTLGRGLIRRAPKERR